MRPVLVALDGGGTRTRCQCYDAEGRLLGEAEGGPSNHLQASREVVRESLKSTIAEALARAGAGPERVALVSAGLAGVDYDGKGAAEAAEILRQIGYPNAAPHGDMVIAHRGALGGDPGVVALAGTGASFLGIAPGGKMAKGGGWGPVYGDEGSGFWIAQQALRAASKAFDGRGPKTCLVDALCGALGITRFEETVVRIYVKGMLPREIAALSPEVSRAAEAGDEVARGILRQAGAELAEGALAMLRRLDMQPGDGAVSYQGSLLARSKPLREEFRARLEREAPGVRIVAPRFEPIMGAYLLGRRQLGWVG